MLFWITWISQCRGAHLRCQGAASFNGLLDVQEQQQQLVQGLCRLMEQAGLVAAKAIAATALLCVAEPCILGAVLQPQLLHQVCLDARSAADSWMGDRTQCNLVLCHDAPDNHRAP